MTIAPKLVSVCVNPCTDTTRFCNQSSFGPVYAQYFCTVITVSVDVRGTNGARSSAGTVLNIQLAISILSSRQWFCIFLLTNGRHSKWPARTNEIFNWGKVDGCRLSWSGSWKFLVPKWIYNLTLVTNVIVFICLAISIPYLRAVNVSLKVLGLEPNLTCLLEVIDMHQILNLEIFLWYVFRIHPSFIHLVEAWSK